MYRTKNQLMIRHVLFVLIVLTVLAPCVLGAPNSVKEVNNRLYINHEDGRIEIWSKTSGELVENITRPSSAEKSLIFYNLQTDGTDFYLAASDGSIYNFNLNEQLWKKINVLSNAFIYALLFDQDSGTIFISGEDTVIRSLNLEEKIIVNISEKFGDPFYALFLDENFLYAVSFKGIVRVWDKNTHRLIKEKSIMLSDLKDMKDEGDVISMLVLEGKMYTGHVGGKIMIWDLESKLFVKEVQLHSKDAEFLDSDSKYIYSASRQGVKIITFEGEPVPIFLDGLKYAPISLAVDKDNLYIGVLEGGVLVYDKADWSLKYKLGELSSPLTSEAYKETVQKPINPLLPIFIVFAFIFIITLVIDVYTKVKKKHRKINATYVKKELASYITAYEAVNILCFASIIILLLGIFNPRLVFPQFVPSLKAIYYFDILVKKGAFMPIWFLLPLSLVWWITGKKKTTTTYAALFVALALLITLFFISPKVI